VPRRRTSLCRGVRAGCVHAFGSSLQDAASRLRLRRGSGGPPVLSARTHFFILFGDHLHVSHATTSCARRQLLEPIRRALGRWRPSRRSSRRAKAQLTSFWGKSAEGSSAARAARFTTWKRCSKAHADRGGATAQFVPGLRAGFYLCFFPGMHVLDAEIFALLEEQQRCSPCWSARPLTRASTRLATRPPAISPSTSRGRPLRHWRTLRSFVRATRALALRPRSRSRYSPQLVELLAVRKRMKR